MPDIAETPKNSSSYDREAYARTRAARLATQKLYYESHKEERVKYQKEYNMANRDRISQKQKVYNRAHADERLKYQKEYDAAKRIKAMQNGQ